MRTSVAVANPTTFIGGLPRTVAVQLAVPSGSSVFRQGRQQDLTLSPEHDYLDAGGEAVIFKTSCGKVIKWYFDTRRFANGELLRKIEHLCGFTHAYVISPKGLVMYQGKPVGYWMDFCPGEPLIKVCDTKYRVKLGMKDDSIKKLVERMRDAVDACHAFGIVLGDPNELNWMMVMGKDGPEPRLLDLDSCQVGQWPAYGVAPLYQDYHTQGFSQGSDWYTFAIITFKLWTGIHPFMGSHPKFTSGTLEQRSIARMKAQVSVLDPMVKVPRIVKNPKVMPPLWLAWYQQMFHSSTRSMPPIGKIEPFTSSMAIGKSRPRSTVRKAAAVRLTQLYDNPDSPVVRVLPQGIVLLKNGTLVEVAYNRELAQVHNLDCEVVNYQGTHRLLADRHADGVYHFSLLGSTASGANIEQVESPFEVTRVLRAADNRLMAVMENGLSDLNIVRLRQPFLQLGHLWPMPTDHVQWFEGVGVLKEITRSASGVIGGVFVVIPDSKPAKPWGEAPMEDAVEPSCMVLRVPELDNLKTVNAKAGNGLVVIVAANRLGNYVRLELVFEKGYNGPYRVMREAVDYNDLNITMLPKGVCAAIIEDGALALSAPRHKVSRTVIDDALSTDMELHHWDNRLVYLQDGAVWEITTL